MDDHEMQEKIRSLKFHIFVLYGLIACVYWKLW